MTKYKAVRTIRYCTKDCLCLYVCPTGASDTENGQIDWDKCIGCGVCAKSCPSHAISMVPYKFPEAQKKDPSIKNALFSLTQERKETEQIANRLSSYADSDEEKLFYKAVAYSYKFSSEDLVREGGYLLPQGEEVIVLLRKLKERGAEDLPVDAIDRLLSLLEAAKE